MRLVDFMNIARIAVSCLYFLSKTNMYLFLVRSYCVVCSFEWQIHYVDIQFILLFLWLIVFSIKPISRMRFIFWIVLIYNIYCIWFIPYWLMGCAFTTSITECRSHGMTWSMWINIFVMKFHILDFKEPGCNFWTNRIVKNKSQNVLTFWITLFLINFHKSFSYIFHKPLMPLELCWICLKDHFQHV